MARIEAAIYPEGDELRELVGVLEAPSLERLAQRIDPACASFPFSTAGGRGSVLLPGISESGISAQARTHLDLLAAAIGESLDDTSFFAYADHLSEGITIYRYPGGEPEIEYINRSAARRIKSTPAEVMLDPGELFRNEKNRRVAIDLMAKVRSGNDAIIEQQVHTLDGSAYWVQLHALPLPEQDGTPRLLNITSDITGVLASEERESVITACIDVTTDAIAIYRLDRDCTKISSLVYGNQAFHVLASNSETNALVSVKDRNGEDLIIPYLPAVIAENSVQCEVAVLASDGTHTLPMELHAHHLRSEVSEADFITISLRDIGTRMVAERERRMLTRAIEESLDFFAIGDFVPPSRGGAHILYINPALTHLVGYTEEELLGRSSGILISPNNTRQLLTTLAENVEHRKSVNLELMLRRKDGRDIWCEVVIQPILDDSEEGGYWLTVGREITLRKQTMGQIALLTWVLDEIDSRITIYEPAETNEFQVAYENNASAESERHLFLELVKEGGIAEKIASDPRFAEEPVRTMVPRLDGPGVTEIEIRALFDGAGHLTAVITMERDTLATERPGAVPNATRLALSTVGMQSMMYAPTSEARLRALSITLREGFGASLKLEQAVEKQPDRLVFEPSFRRATMYYSTDGPKRADIRWETPLGQSDLTTLRLALETFLGASKTSA